MESPLSCPSCGAPLTGQYCASCGQQRLEGRLTVRDLARDVTRRVYRFDSAFALTLWRLLREPATLMKDYLAGRRVGYLDPIQYLISALFVQLLVTTFTHWLAPLLDRSSAFSWLWLGRLNGVLALKVLTIFWMGTLWRVMFRPGRYNLAEIYVLAMYAFGTTTILWAVLPLLDLAVPQPLGADPVVVLLVMLVLESAYLTYVVRKVSGLPVWESLARVVAVLTFGYAILIAIMGPGRLARLLLPLRQG